MNAYVVMTFLSLIIYLYNPKYLRLYEIYNPKIKIDTSF